MKIVCFIGSGFNYMLADILKPRTDLTIGNITLHEKIISLNKLWQEFDHPLLQFNSFIPDRYGEHMLEALDNIQTLLQKSSSRDNNVHPTGNTIHPILDRFVKEHLHRVGRRFTEFEMDGGYSKINKAFSNLGRSFNNILERNLISDFYLCTTNYDGIVDSLLTYYCKNELKRKFIFKDGFINGVFDSALFKRSDYKVAHLHGSYRYYNRQKGTIKLPKGVINENPVMIYGNPYRKEATILDNHVLAANFHELQRQLTTCNKVITIGNSFKSEPHLKRLLSTHFNRPDTEMIICSDKPDEVLSELKPYYDFNISARATGHVKSERELIELFDQLLGHTSMNTLATA